MYIAPAVPSLSRLGALAVNLSNGFSDSSAYVETAVRSIDQAVLQSTRTIGIISSTPAISTSTNTNLSRLSSSLLPKYTAKTFSSAARPATPKTPSAPKKTNAWEGLVPGLLVEGAHINPYDLSTLIPIAIAQQAGNSRSASSTTQIASKPVDWGADWASLGTTLPTAALSSLSSLVPLSVPRPSRTALAGMLDSSTTLSPARTSTSSVAATSRPSGASVQPQSAKSLPGSTSVAASTPAGEVTLFGASETAKASLAAATQSPAAALASASAAKAKAKDANAEKGVPKLLYRFPNGTWIENLAVSPNSDLLLTLYDRPELYRFDPRAAGQAPVLVRRFAEEGHLSGITETAANEYAVLVSRTLKSKKKQTELWAVRCDDACDGELQYSRRTGKLNVEWIGGPYGELGALSGMTAAGSGLVLASDAVNGRIYGFGVPGMTASLVLGDARMVSPGIAGIRLVGNTLYFTNMLLGVFARLKVDVGRAVVPWSNARPMAEAGGGAVMSIAASPVEIIAKGLVGVNDFAVSPKEDVAYVADYGGNALLKVDLRDGTVSKFAHIRGGPTSAQFGRRKEDADVVYVTTSSGAVYSVRV